MTASVRKLFRTIAVNCLVLVIAVVLLDVLAYWLLPAPIAARFEGYRLPPPPLVLGRGRVIHDYWAPHETRGFDIGAGARAVHWVDGLTYDIWSNSLQCFDDEHDDFDDYIYFAGDSFTWGYTPFEEKFGTLLAAQSPRPILTCGVPNTGQLAQLSKLQDIADRVGSPPTTLFVFYFANDLANDFAFPHSTVIDGWQLDTVSLDSDQNLVQRSRQDLQDELQRQLVRLEGELASERRFAGRLKAFLKRYSITAQVVDRARSAVAGRDEHPPANAAGGAGRRGAGIYTLPWERDGRYWFADNPNAARNKEAIAGFEQYAAAHGTELVFVLIPPKEQFDNVDYYGDLHEFLDDRGIRYLDLTGPFHAAGYSVGDLYWANDSHLNPGGNAAVASILAGEFPDIFRLAPDPGHAH